MILLTNVSKIGNFSQSFFSHNLSNFSRRRLYEIAAQQTLLLLVRLPTEEDERHYMTVCYLYMNSVSSCQHAKSLCRFDRCESAESRSRSSGRTCFSAFRLHNSYDTPTETRDAQQSNAVLYRFSGLHLAERQPGETRTQILLISY